MHYQNHQRKQVLNKVPGPPKICPNSAGLHSGESAYLDPPADVNFNKNSVVSTQDPEPMEVQELKITSQTDASNIIDLTNTQNSEVMENRSWLDHFCKQ